MRLGNVWLFLLPGLGLKRWILALGAAICSLGLGLAFLVAIPVSPIVLPFLRTLTLSSYSGAVRGSVFLVIGVLLATVALRYLYRLIVIGASEGRTGVNVLENLYDHRHRNRGPNVVVIGGGTGLSVLLNGLKKETDNLTAVVTMADDGGSSGRLRRDLKMPPPGDARNCMVALSRDESLVGELFDYRFADAGDLTGHSLGNLLLAALYDTQEDFESALMVAGTILGLSGRVIPVSKHGNLVLQATTNSGTILTGESVIGVAGETLETLSVLPDDAYVAESVVEAVAFADLVIIGPGSLYTSILPNLLVNGMRETLEACSAPIVFVCNIVTEVSENNYTLASDYVQAVRSHGGVDPTHILMNAGAGGNSVDSEDFVVPVPKIEGFLGRLVVSDLLNEDNPSQHDPQKLARKLMGFIR